MVVTVGAQERDNQKAYDVSVHPPNSFAPSLCAPNFDITTFMGRWQVVYSTLPMWKSKKDVSISYTPVELTDDGRLLIDDLVEYRSLSASSKSSLSRIHGVDTAFSPPNPSGVQSAVHFKWRGKGFLSIATSKWQVLGFDPNRGWAVTYFEKTLFTPAGIDIYVRDGVQWDPELMEEIVKRTKAVGGEFGELAQKMFAIKRG